MSDNQNALKKLSVYLAENSLRLTQSRRAVIQTVMETEGHFDIQIIEEKLRKSGVHRATLYRTLPLLEKVGIIRRVRDNDAHWHYEHVIGHTHHDHLVCERCGRIIEIKSKSIEEEQRRICVSHGFEEKSHLLVIRGLCSKCHSK